MMIYYLMIALSQSCFSTEPSASKPGTELKIIADEMECDQNQNKCVATGNAFAESLNDANGRTLKAEKFIAYFAKKKTSPSEASTSDKKGEKSKFEKLEAIGKVIITDNGTIIHCDRAEYLIANERIDLFDNVKITQGLNQLEGSHGTADLKDHKYKIINTGKQVQALIVDTKGVKDKGR